MSLKEEIETQVKGYLNSKYDIKEGYIIPDKTDIGFGAKAKILKRPVAMYVDLRGSRELLSDHTALIAARAHKSFLYAAAKCVRDQDGKLRSFNGDSLLSFFSSEKASNRAVRSAMKLKGVINNIINPILEEKNIKKLNFGIGIGIGEILVAKSGIPGEEIHQDLIWIGWPTYHVFEYGNMAKSPKNIWISKNVFNEIKDDDYLRYSNGEDMWVYSDSHTFSFGKIRVYKTQYQININ
jgi:adenylate cyclase